MTVLHVLLDTQINLGFRQSAILKKSRLLYLHLIHLTDCNQKFRQLNEIFSQNHHYATMDDSVMIEPQDVGWVVKSIHLVFSSASWDVSTVSQR